VTIKGQAIEEEQAMSDVGFGSAGRLQRALKDTHDDTGHLFISSNRTRASGEQKSGCAAGRGVKAEEADASVQRSSRLAVAALLAAGCVWGSGFLFGKLAFTELPVSHVALYRFAIATLVLLPWALARGARPCRRDLPIFLLTGFLVVPATFLPQYAGLALTSATSASLIIGTLPPMLALAAFLFYGERLSRRSWIAVGTSTLGVALVVGLPSDGHSWVGDGLVFLSMIVIVAWVLLSKPLVEKYTALVATAYIMLFGTLTMLPISLVWDGAPQLPLSSGVLLSVLALGLACSALTYGLWNWGLTYVSASHAGIYTNIEPLVGVLLGVTFLNESLSAGAIIGGLLVLASALVVSRTKGSA
jgi:drug/metabolite transporter (DMT)-like permease